MAGDGGAGLGGHCRDVGSAFVAGVGAAGVIGATGGDGGQGGHVSGDLREPAFGVSSAQGGEQSARVRVPGCAGDFGGGAALHDAAGVHDHDCVGCLGEEAEVVGDEDEGHSARGAEGDQQVHDFGLGCDIQRGGGFVGDDEVGFGDEGGGDDDALSHSAGEFVGVGAHSLVRGGDGDFAEFLEGDVFRVRALGDAVRGEDFGELVADGEDGVEGGHRVLKDGGDFASARLSHFLLGEGEQVASGEADGSGGDFSGGSDEVDDGGGEEGFSGAGFADDAEALAGGEGEGDIG